MKFLIDMPLSPNLADWLKPQGHEASHVSQINLAHEPDENILKYAQDNQMVVITADLDFPRLFALLEITSPGLILFRGGNFSDQEMLKLLQKVFSLVPLEELQNTLIVVDKERIRRRPLPIIK